jgi:hypothetical protein
LELQDELQRATEALEDERMLNDDEEELCQILLLHLQVMEEKVNRLQSAGRP